MYSKNILILTNWSYKDALIQTYTLPYVRIIRKYLCNDKKVFINTLEQERYALTVEQEIEAKIMLANEGINWKGEPYHKPGIFSVFSFMIHFLKLLYLCKKERIGVIHIWCTPPSIMAYILSIFTGAAIVIDSYEPHAESMVENGQWKRNSLKFKVLFLFEKLISKRAKAIISATDGMKLYAKNKYNIEGQNFFVKPACVDVNLFSSNKIKIKARLDELGLGGKLVCVYAGKFGGIYLEDEIFDFFKVAHDFWGNNFRVLLLTSHSRQEIEIYCKKSGLDARIVINLFVPHQLVAEYMGLADFAITPVKPVFSKRFCTPIKDGEYWALGLPVVIPRNISDDSEIIEKNGIGAVLADFTKEEYFKAVKNIDNLLTANENQTLNNKIRKIAVTYRSFSIAENIYREIYY
jgi:hypothetical protein